MGINVGTEKQLKAKNIIENIIVWALCPLWLPIVLLLFILTVITDVLENIVLDCSKELISTFTDWLVRKLVKQKMKFTKHFENFVQQKE